MAVELRDWYLGALGVVRYRPRDAEPLAGGEDTADPETEESAAIVSSPVHEAAGAALEALKKPAAEAPPVENPAPRSTAAASTVAAKPAPAQEAGRAPGAEEPVQFRLAFWQPCDSLVVLSTMPPGIRPSQPQQEMLANLLKAINRLPAELPRVELLDWPLAPGRDSSLGGARELLTAFLDVKHRLKPFPRALLMGELTARVLEPIQDAVAVGDHLSLSCGAQGVVTHSLYEMEREKPLKRATWEAIRFLAGEAG